MSMAKVLQRMINKLLSGIKNLLKMVTQKRKKFLFHITIMVSVYGKRMMMMKMMEI